MTKSGLAVVLGLSVAAVGVIVSYQQQFVSKVIEKATEAPSATATATDAPTQAPNPTAIPPATAETWSVAFYPDNWTYQLEEHQCALINWTSTGVTDLKFGSEGSAGEKVEATGRKDFLCFIGRKEADFFLEYRKPDGQLERKTIHLERNKNESTSKNRPILRIIPKMASPTPQIVWMIKKAKPSATIQWMVKKPKASETAIPSTLEPQYEIVPNGDPVLETPPPPAPEPAQPTWQNGSFTSDQMVVCKTCKVDEARNGIYDWDAGDRNNPCWLHGYNGHGDHLVITDGEKARYPACPGLN